MCVFLGPKEGKFVIALKFSYRASLYFIGIIEHHMSLLSKLYGEKLLLKFHMNNKEIKEEKFPCILKCGIHTQSSFLLQHKLLCSVHKAESVACYG